MILAGSIDLVVEHLEQVLAVAVFKHGLGQLVELLGRNPARAEGDLFQTRHFQALALFQGGDELAGLAAQYLDLRKVAIYGGTNEVQKNLIARAILGA